MGIENSIQQGIRKTLKQRQEFLLRMLACPYASEALLTGQVQIFETSADRLPETVRSVWQKYLEQVDSIFLKQGAQVVRN